MVALRRAYANTTYYGRVAAINGAGVPTNTNLVPAGILTPVAVPTSLAANTAALTSANFSWNANGNPGYTHYEVSISTDNFVLSISTPVSVSASTGAVSAIISNLTGNTSYWFRVRAFNQNLIPSNFAMLEYFFTSQSYKVINLTGNGVLSYAYTDSLNPSKGYSDYVAAGSTMVYRIDGEGNGRTDFLISTQGNYTPTYYWDPDINFAYKLIAKDVLGNGVMDYIFDSNNDGIPDSYFNPATGVVAHSLAVTGVPTVPGTFLNFNGGSGGYNVYVDSTGQTNSVVSVAALTDGKNEFLIDTKGKGIPDKFVNPNSGLITPIKLFDYSGDGTLDWGIDVDGAAGTLNTMTQKRGILLDIFTVTEQKSYVPSPNPFNPLKGNATFVYDMSFAGPVIIDIYDIAGEKVAVLVNSERTQGRHQFMWNGGNGEYDASDGEVVGRTTK